MADDFVAIDISGDEKVKRFLDRVPTAVGDAAVEAGADYMINVLKLNPPQRYVSRAAAYGQTFQSEKQRRFFFAALGDGRIEVPYRRSQAQAQGWKKIGSGMNLLVANETPGVAYTRGDDTQSRHAAMIGWKTVGKEVEDHRDKLHQRMLAAANNAVKRLEREA